ncbi:restriction endonuclease subunit S [Enterobacter quasiroggenkampii]|uniref:restriction endonuclease subunit S n=1 Tax=Enterobacter quasiroggenkampii TaxID=2497436 RepID=UPI0021D3520A|nr:restriction endonuclease subunit S [Enterobacter quasiroggenkampii]MBW4241185.1 restriction endonuclease subunit S [Enterobacter roggenkampii]MCU6408161.1 restriction endonuclease subunit S [Enterobacter quasiroggenkampii]
MGSKCNIVKLKEVVDVITSKVDVSLINISDYISTENMLTDFQGTTLANNIPNSGKITRFSQGDILFSNIRTYFKKIWLADRPGACSNDVIVFRPKNNIESEYVFSILMDPKFTDHTVLTSKGTKMPRGDKKAILDYEFNLASNEERKYISKINNIIFKKINCNKLINSTLEQMSQTLFKSWFVDFDPVIDNALDAGNPIPEALQSRAELRQKVRNSADFKPLPADIRAMFPAEFEEAESGSVPMGWKEGSIPDIAFINPTSWGTKNQPNYVNYVDLSNAKDGIISSIDKISFKEAPSRARRILKKDDLIFGLVRPANRSFAYVHIDGLTGSTGFAVIRAKNTIYKNFIYYFVTYDKNVEELARIADGGAYPAIKPDDICSLPLIIPSEEIVERFDELTSNFRYLMNNSLVQNDFLTNLRDTLLPKLISGELSLEDLPDLIKQTEAA